MKPGEEVGVIMNKEDGSQEKEGMKWREVTKLLLQGFGRPTDRLSEIAAVMGLSLPALGCQLVPTERLGRHVVSSMTGTINSANLGLSNSVVGFHIDVGYAGMSAVAGDCEKIWMFAPPSIPNTDLLYGDNTSLAHLVANFDELTILRQIANNVVFLSLGIVHATFTIKTGILYGCSFRTRENCLGATIGLLKVMGESVINDDHSERDGIIETWVEMMEDIGANGEECHKKEALLALFSSGMKACRRGGDFGRKARLVEEMIETYFPRAILKKEKSHE